VPVEPHLPQDVWVRLLLDHDRHVVELLGELLGQVLQRLPDQQLEILP
jgi:hypothetical protein